MTGTFTQCDHCNLTVSNQVEPDGEETSTMDDDVKDEPEWIKVHEDNDHSAYQGRDFCSPKCLSEYYKER